MPAATGSARNWDAPHSPAGPVSDLMRARRRCIIPRVNFRPLVLSKVFVIQLFLGISCVAASNAGVTFHGPSAYLSFTNSPFFDMPGFEYFYLETFEDWQLNTPGVTTSTGWTVIGQGSLTDSVDADDGIVDGAGDMGHSLLSGGTQSNLVVYFDAQSLGGNLPNHVGIVCTDVGAVLFGEFCVGDVTLEAFDAGGASLGSVTATNLGNGSVLGSGPNATSEDRFLGVANSGGISSIRISINNSVDWEVDHLQYGCLPVVGVSVPELRIRLGAPGEVVLSWPTNAAGYSLQESVTLPSTGWDVVPTPPTIVNGEYQVTISPLADKRFYRLLGAFP